MRPEIVVFMIPIIAIVMGMGSGMLGMFLNYRKRKEMFALFHQQRMAAIDKGIELPPLPDDFFREAEAPMRRSFHGTLLAGLILLFIGVTLYVSMHFTVPRMDNGGDPSLYALIPAGIGAANLIYYFAVGRNHARAYEEERKAKMAELARAKNPTI
jgi:hypothetical protein